MNTKIKSKRIGDIQKVQNSKQHWVANSEYNFIRVQLSNGKEVALLLTDKELARAIERATKNPEDLPKTSVFRNMFD